MKYVGGYPVARGPGLNNAGHDGRWKHRFDIDTDPPGGVEVFTPRHDPGARWKVEISAYDPDGYGNWIEIVEVGGRRNRHVYAHLRARAVQAGVVLGPGELLGRTGNTGRSTAEHLHWECSYGTASQAWRIADTIWEGNDMAILDEDDQRFLKNLIKEAADLGVGAKEIARVVGRMDQHKANHAIAGGAAAPDEVPEHKHKQGGVAR